MKSRTWSKIVGILFLVILYVLLWWGLSYLVSSFGYDFQLRSSQFIQLAIIVGFIFGVLFTVFIEKLIRQELLIKHLSDYIHKILKK